MSLHVQTQGDLWSNRNHFSAKWLPMEARHTKKWCVMSTCLAATLCHLWYIQVLLEGESIHPDMERKVISLSKLQYIFYSQEFIKIMFTGNNLIVVFVLREWLWQNTRWRLEWLILCSSLLSFARAVLIERQLSRIARNEERWDYWTFLEWLVSINRASQEKRWYIVCVCWLLKAEQHTQCPESTTRFIKNPRLDTLGTSHSIQWVLVLNAQRSKLTNEDGWWKV